MLEKVPGAACDFGDADGEAAVTAAGIASAVGHAVGVATGGVGGGGEVAAGRAYAAAVGGGLGAETL